MKRKKIFTAGIAIAIFMLPAFNLLQAKAAEGSNCMMVVTYSEMAYLKFKDAGKASEIEAARKFIQKGMDYAKQAASYAPQCDCPLAETYALEAYTFGKKAYDAAALKDTRKQAKKAMDLSLSGMSAAQQCNNNK
ncbi:hypothetical protein DBR32_10480 [Taibaiella sp. KBW10]|uniref:hypothetical protein n=1 Tax=Taibaiella sp. KBW10 TaxID=2153357 RepID=UPI000F5B5968|nr:hypothetical protein [Taibaiella sp. KBW10]RQO31121.1 hypothetical protein DBR32_10480 [Taibaiella sp. KBW10]